MADAISCSVVKLAMASCAAMMAASCMTELIVLVLTTGRADMVKRKRAL